MKRKEILETISEIIYQTKTEGDQLKKKTVVDTYHVGGLSGNRLNSGTLRSQFIICEKESDWNRSDISARKAIHSDQRIFVQKGDNDVWDVYRGKTLDSESEEPILLLQDQPNLSELLNQEREYLLSDNKQLIKQLSIYKNVQIIYYGCPGSGKSHMVNKVVNGSFLQYLSSKDLKEISCHKYANVLKTQWIVNIAKESTVNIESLYDIDDIERINKVIENPKFIEKDAKGQGMYSTALKHYIDYLNKKKNIFRTTFHPDTDYTSFVGCFKPSMNNGNIEYNYSAQVFTNAYVKAWQNPEEKVYLIIEEINRGNCAQIFGDLFQLLDRDKTTGKSEYPIKADKDLVAYIEKVLGAGHEGIKDGELCLPSNLIIYATMNTSDQSLFPMDSAFKRRWDWEYVPINYSEDIDSGKFTIKLEDNTEYLWIKFLEKVNDKIYDATNSEDKQMGNFFIKKSVDAKEFINKVMFYLWNEVCKEEYGTQRNFFRKGKDGKTEFKFTELFGVDQTTILNEFMTSLGVEPTNKPKPEEPAVE